MMINEENKIPAEEQAVHTDSAQSEVKKKLSTPVLIGIIAGAVAVIALAVILCLTLGGGCKEHVDADDDFLCDNCGKDYNDGIEAVIADVTFTVKYADGASAAGVGFYLTGEDEDPIRLETDESGKVTYTLEGGKYTVDYDYDTISPFISSDTYALTVVKGMDEVVITLSDNTPDGSAEKPFYLSENETEITLKPGEELHFNYRGAATKYLTINSDKLVVIYDGVEYTAVDGVIEVAVTPKEIGVSTVFKVKNISDTTVNETMMFLAPLGSMDNPYNLNEDDECHTVPGEGTVYYKWTAYDDMVLVVYVPDHKVNSVAITKVLENDVPISSLSAGEAFVYMPVCKDDLITITVSTNNKQDTIVEFEGYFFTGDESDPVSVLVKEIDVSFTQGQSVVFTTKSGNTVNILDENASVVYNGTTYTPDENGVISFAVAQGCNTFTVTNTSEYVNSILIKVEGTLDAKPEYGASSNMPSN